MLYILGGFVLILIFIVKNNIDNKIYDEHKEMYDYYKKHHKED
jgi:hypothetical protein